MAKNDRIIENAVSGERIVVVKTAAETGGELFAFELFLRPGARVPAAHAHPQQQERFTVLDGRVRFRLGTRARVAQAGESVTVTAGTSHSFANVGDDEAHLLVEVRPAMRMEDLLATAAELSDAGGRPRRLPAPLDVALFLHEFRREVTAPLVPAALVRAVVAPVAWLARSCRLDGRYRALRARHAR
jgi:quercetin dioxygenase-like cupin family protein